MSAHEDDMIDAGRHYNRAPSTTPEANRPLTGDDVKLLKAGDRLKVVNGDSFLRQNGYPDGALVTFRAVDGIYVEIAELHRGNGSCFHRFQFVSRPTQPEPVPMALGCPQCGVAHLDEGEWATRPHKTHQCQSCGHEWRPYEYPTVGVTQPEPERDGAVERVTDRADRAWAAARVGWLPEFADAKAREQLGKRDAFWTDVDVPESEVSGIYYDDLRTVLSLLSTAERQRDEAVRALAPFAAQKVNGESNSSEIVPNGYSSATPWRENVLRARQALQSMGSGYETRALNEGG